jgi:putative transposase
MVGTIRSFNMTEEPMGKQGAAWRRQREREWHERLARQAVSGQSVAAFCRSKGIAEGTFYWWRAHLRSKRLDAEHGQAEAVAPAAFIDVGMVTSVAASNSSAPAVDRPRERCGEIEVRIDLGAGLLLQIVKR